MTRRRLRMTSSVLAGVGVLMLTGCSGDSGSPDGRDGSTTGDEEKSPLAEYLGYDTAPVAGPGGGVMISARALEPSEEESKKEREVQDLVAACMQEQGFEYVPYVPDRDETSAFDEAYSLPPEKFAEQYGYGISTLMDMADPEGEESDDPNQAIAQALTPDALAAYQEALWGEGVEVTDGGASVSVEAVPGGPGGVPAPADQGCMQKASEEVYALEGAGRGGEGFQDFDSLFTDIDALRQRIDGDPRLTDATQQWVDCMADAGFSEFTKPDDPATEVSDRMSALFGDLPSEDSEEKSTHLVNPVALDRAELDKVQEYELDVAPADFACRRDHYEDIYREVQFELEAEFVEDHKTDLEAFQEWSSSNSASFGVG